MIKTLKTIRRFLLPNRSDVPLIAVSLFLFTVSLMPEFIPLIWESRKLNFPAYLSRDVVTFLPQTFFAIIFGSVFGACDRRHLRSNWGWLLIVGAIFLYMGWLLSSENSWRYSSKQASDARMNWAWFVWLSQLAVFVVSWVATTMLMKFSAFKMANLKGGRISRAKILILAAVALFVVASVGNIIRETGLGEAIGNGGGQGVLSTVVLALICVMLLSAVPAWINEQFRGWGSLPLLLLHFSGVGLAFAMLSDWKLLFGIVPLLLLATILMAGFKVYRNSAEARVNPLNSFWSLTIALSVLVVATGLHFFSLRPILQNGANSWTVARQVKQLSTAEGVAAQIQTSVAAPGAAYEIFADFALQSNADPKFLTAISQSASRFSFSFTGLTPQIETKYLAGLKIYGWGVQDSEITPEQFENLSAGTTYANISHSRIMASGSVSSQSKHPLKLANLSSVGNLLIQDMDPGETEKLLAAIDTKTCRGMTIRFYTGNEFSIADWRQILKASRDCSIFINQKLTPEFIEEAKSMDESGRISIVFDELSVADRFNVLLDTPLEPSQGFWGDAADPQIFWDACYARNRTNWSFSNFRGSQIGPVKKETEFENGLANYHWIFATHKNGQPRKMLIPLQGESYLVQLSELTELETLSFDPAWLESLREIPNIDRPALVDLSPLAKLTKLKRLDLYHNLFDLDLSFLASLPDLEQLQIDVYGDGTGGLSFDFQAEYCPALMKLVVLGIPNKALTEEIARLPKLETLVVVDLGFGMNFGMRQKELKSWLERIGAVLDAKVELKVISGADYKAEPPAEFHQHLKRVRQQIRDKYLGDVNSN